MWIADRNNLSDRSATHRKRNAETRASSSDKPKTFTRQEDEMVDTDESPSAKSPVSIKERLDHERRSLLDLSNRNSLLNFRRQRSAGVQVVDTTCEDVFRRLVIETRKFTFRHDPEAENPESQENPEAQVDPSGEIVSNQPRVTRRSSQNSLQTPYSSTELARRMRRTHSRARTALEETGVNVLFVALGALEWYESDSSKIARRAPLVLVPVTLDQSDVRGDFRIYYSDEDFGTNLSLREKLEREFGINLPELPTIEEIDVLSYFRDVEKVISKQTRWRVDDTAIDLNFFSFTRYTMYQDLGSDNWPDDDQPADHPVMTAILGDGFSSNSELSDAQPVAPEELDRKFAPGKPSVIMDADGSQLLAIIEANSGINLVIQGPPGTGKSQTIANILAEAIEQDKKVLFVSEKMAALEVVKSRLDAVGLGVACLELHSNKARKTEVLTDLKNTFALGEPVSSEIRSTTLLIANDRQRLNEYCSAVNTPIGNSGMTPVQAYGRTMQVKSELKDAVVGKLEIKGASDWDVVERDRKLSLVEELDAHLADHGAPSDNPLNRSRISQPPLPGQFQTIDDNYGVFSSSVHALEINTKELAKNLGRPDAISLSEIQNLARLCTLLLEAPDTSGVDTASVVWREHADDLAYVIDTEKRPIGKSNVSPIHAYGQIKHIESEFPNIADHSLEVVNASAWNDEDRDRKVGIVKELDAYLAEHGAPSKNPLCRSGISSSPKPSQFRTINAAWQKFSSSMDVLTNDAKQLAESLELPEPKTVPKVGRLIDLCHILLEAPDTSSLSPSSDAWKEHANSMSDLIDGGKSLTASVSNRSVLWNYRNHDVGELREIESNYTRRGGKWYSFLFKDYRNAKKQVAEIFDMPDKFKYEDAVTQLGDVIAFKDIYDDVVSQESVLQDIVLDYSSPIKVDWDAVDGLDKYLRWARSPQNAGRLVISAERLEIVKKNESVLKEIEASLKELKDSYNDILSGLELDHHDDLAFTNRSSDTLDDLGAMVSIWREDLRTNWTSIANYNGLKTLLDDEGLGDVAEYAWNYDLSRGSLSILVEYRFYEDILEHGFNLTERLRFDRIVASIHSVLPDVIDGYSDHSDLMEVDWGKIEDVAIYLQRMRSPRNAGNLVISAELLSNAVNSKATLETIESSLKSLEESYSNILSGFELDHHDDLGFSNNASVSLIKLRDTVSSWHRSGLQTWRSIATFNQISSQLKREGLDGVVECAWNWDSSEASLLSLVKYRIYNDLVDTALKECSSLRDFDRSVHEYAIERFRQSDPMLMDMTKSEVSRRHWNGIPRSGSGGEMAFLQNEMAKKRRILPIRRLLERAGRAVQAIKPIFMMSPLSVATYLTPSNIEFDMVVFDEASQVKPVDAFGAILRGNSTVVVGDSRQLPPTSFFDRVSEETDEDDFDQNTSDLESVLDLFVARGAREKTLQWHYRSQHESLIAVSNKEFYQDQLLVAPSPDSSMIDLGVQFRHLPHTHYTKGGRNRGEALEVAKAVMDHARNYPHLSLGVAAFSKSQADVIGDEVDRLIREDKSMNVDFFSRHPEEPFFVKNLENVQGDERDVIFISVGYGRQADGVLRMNFGPLNTQGGERRMNVLITRAKRRCVVFSNITSGDIDLSKTDARGVRSLKTYLEFAETGRLDSPKVTGMGADSPFEEWVARELRSKGYRVEEQVGTGQYRIDLAVVDDKKPGHYLLGIECDGASYHSSKTARDRDRIRQDTLESKGWKIHRIWSTDWFYSPKEEMDRLVRVIEDARSESDLDVKHFNMRVESVASTVSTAVIERKESSGENSSALSNVAYVAWKPKRRRLRISAVHKNWDTIRRQIVEIVNVEWPVHVSEVRCRISDETGPSLTARDDATVRSYAEKSRKIQVKGDFLYKVKSRVRFVRDRSELSSRSKNIDLIAAEEIQLAIRQVVKESIGIHVDELPRAVCSMLGLGSTTEKRRKAIFEHLELMKRRKRVVESNGVLELVSRGR